MLRRNIERSKEITDEKRKASAEAGGPEPGLKDEPRHGSAIPADQDNDPAGGTTGSEQNLGGGYKSEPSH